MKKRTVSVVVTTKNNMRTIEKCLASVLLQSYPCDLWVVDNQSTDGTLAVAQKYTKHVFTCGPERSNQRNFAVQRSKSDYFFFIDSDMALTPDVVRDCVSLLEKGCDAVIVPEIFHGEGFWTHCKCFEKSLYFGTGDGEAARFFRRDIFFTAGMYDERLIGTEDIDFHKKVLRLGRVCRGTEVIHHYDDRLTLWYILKKRYYYALTLDTYLSQNKQESRSEMRFIRPAYITKWKTLVKHPVYTFGFLFMRFFESVAVLYGLWKGKKKKTVH